MDAGGAAKADRLEEESNACTYDIRVVEIKMVGKGGWWTQHRGF